MAKNLKAKTRPVSNPYETVESNGWKWKILKHYQAPNGEWLNAYARVFCFVTSPYCPQGEYGDVYIKDIPSLREILRDASGSAEPTAPPAKAEAKVPSQKTLEKWMFDGVAKATDGCRVEPDGVCQHGCPSWLVKLGII